MAKRARPRSSSHSSGKLRPILIGFVSVLLVIGLLWLALYTASNTTSESGAGSPQVVQRVYNCNTVGSNKLLELGLLPQLISLDSWQNNSYETEADRLVSIFSRMQQTSGDAFSGVGDFYSYHIVRESEGYISTEEGLKTGRLAIAVSFVENSQTQSAMRSVAQEPNVILQINTSITAGINDVHYALMLVHEAIHFSDMLAVFEQAVSQGKDPFGYWVSLRDTEVFKSDGRACEEGRAYWLGASLADSLEQAGYFDTQAELSQIELNILYLYRTYAHRDRGQRWDNPAWQAQMDSYLDHLYEDS